MADINVENLDLYGILDITITASSSEIRTAYRKKALKCHPDKNPDDPKAAETFLKLTKALEVLLDESARAAYDRVIKAKEAARLRHQALDEKRKKFKEDLEARERATMRGGGLSDTEKLRKEIERLQKEGAKLVQEEMRKLQEEILRDLQRGSEGSEPGACQLKVEWDSSKKDDLYTEETLRRIFSKYGDVEGIVISSKKKGKGLIEFKSESAADLAEKIEKGFASIPLKVTWANKSKRDYQRNQHVNAAKSDVISDRDYESLVVRNLRQAEERKRLIAQMQQEDEA